MSRRALVTVGALVAAALLAACSPSAGQGAADIAPAARVAAGGDAATPSPSSSPRGSSGSTLIPAVQPDVITRSGARPDVVFRVRTSKPVFFITVDDGVRKQAAAVDYVRRTHLPVTTFLYNGVVGGKYDYFSRVSAYDAVQNHTMDHKALSKASTDVRYEICRAQRIYAAKFGVRPWILRPPYGAGMYSGTPTSTRNRILDAAASCGIKHIAMWNVSVSSSGSVSYASGGPLRRGDIVLLHFEGDLASNLAKVVRLGRKAGLTPAPLSAFLAK